MTASAGLRHTTLQQTTPKGVAAGIRPQAGPPPRKGRRRCPRHTAQAASWADQWERSVTTRSGTSFSFAHSLVAPCDTPATMTGCAGYDDVATAGRARFPEHRPPALRRARTTKGRTSRSRRPQKPAPPQSPPSTRRRQRRTSSTPHSRPWSAGRPTREAVRARRRRTRPPA